MAIVSFGCLVTVNFLLLCWRTEGFQEMAQICFGGISVTTNWFNILDMIQVFGECGGEKHWKIKYTFNKIKAKC